MAGSYLDTSALGRILLAEPDAVAIRQALADYDAWWSSALLIVELRRLAARENLEAIAERMLSGVRTVAVDTASIERASRLQRPEVRTLRRDPSGCRCRASRSQRGRSGAHLRSPAADGMCTPRAADRGAWRAIDQPSGGDSLTVDALDEQAIQGAHDNARRGFSFARIRAVPVAAPATARLLQ